MAWIQRVALLLQRCSTVPSLTRAGLGSHFTAPAAGRPSYFDNTFAALSRGASYCRTYGVAARLDEEDDIPDFSATSFDGKRNAGAGTPSLETFEAMRSELESILSSKELPRKRILMDLVQNASSKEQIDEMFELLKRVKIERAVLRQQTSPLNPQVSVQVALACGRAGEVEKGLVTVQHRNAYQLRPSLDAAHVLIDKAGEKKDVDLVVKIFRALLEAGLNPKPSTADLVMRALARGGQAHVPKFFRFAEEFFINGIKIWSGWYEKLMSKAMLSGEYELFAKWARRRQAGGLAVAKRSGFNMAKGYVLMGDAERAADILIRGRAHFKSGAEEGDAGWDALCRDLVIGWPKWLHEQRVPKVDYDKLKATLLELEELLKQQRVRFEVDVAKYFRALGTETAKVRNASEGLGEGSGTEDSHGSTAEVVGSDGEHSGEPPADVDNVGSASATGVEPIGEVVSSEDSVGEEIKKE